MSVAVVLGLSLVLAVSLGTWLVAYETGYEAATIRGTATVVGMTVRTKRPDVIEVTWHGRDGVDRWREFEVGNGANYPVGTAVRIRTSAAQPDQVYPEHRDQIDETSTPTVSLIVLLVVMTLATLLWLWRAVQWQRARAAPARRHRARVVYVYGRSQVLGIPVLSFVDDGQPYYQRVMWEPWVPGIEDELMVEVRRAGRGPFVIDVPGFGRLWPSGSARRRPPKGRSRLGPRPVGPGSAGPPRWSSSSPCSPCSSVRGPAHSRAWWRPATCGCSSSTWAGRHCRYRACGQ